MLLNSEQVLGLSLFSDLSNNYDKISDKLHICYEDGILTFTQLGPVIKMQKEIPVDSDEEPFTSLYDTFSFVKLIKNMPEEFYLTAEGIKLEGKDSIYALDQEDLRGYPDIDSVFNLVPEKTIKLTDLKKMKKADYYTGVDGLSVVSLQEDNFVSSDSVLVYFTKTANKSESILNIPKAVARILYGYLDDIEINIGSINGIAVWGFDLGEIKFVIVDQPYSLPDLMTDSYRNQYNLPEYVEFQKDELMGVIGRMRIISQDNAFNRIFINIISEDTAVIESRDKNKSREAIPITISSSALITDAQNVDAQIVVSCTFLNKIIQSIEGDVIRMHVSADKSVFNVVIFKGGADDVRIIHCLYSAI